MSVLFLKFFKIKLNFSTRYDILAISANKQSNQRTERRSVRMQKEVIPNLHAILYDRELNCKERLAMLMFLDADGIVNIGYDKLAELMGVNRSTAITTVKALEEKGYVKCYRKNAGRRDVTNRYVVTI